MSGVTGGGEDLFASQEETDKKELLPLCALMPETNTESVPPLDGLYWNVNVAPDNETNFEDLELIGNQIPPEDLQVPVTFQVTMDIPVKALEAGVEIQDVFLGPKDPFVPESSEDPDLNQRSVTPGNPMGVSFLQPPDTTSTERLEENASADVVKRLEGEFVSNFRQNGMSQLLY